MPHEIDLSTGSAAVFVSGEPPWHGLGKVIEEAATSAEAIKLAGLDWRVQQWPISAIEPSTWKMVKAHDYVANVRSDTKAVIGVVGRGYRVFQNHEAFQFMDTLIGDKLAMFETAGSLKDGRRVWMLARIPKEYRAGPDDLIQPYVLLVNSHDGSTALRMLPTSVRVVCQNTLNLALSSGGTEGLCIRHHASLEQRVEDARAKLGIIAARFDQFDQELHAMLASHPSTNEVEGYFQDLIPPAYSQRAKTNRTRILEKLEENFGNERNTLTGMKGTTWAAFNAVSEWTDHQRRFRGEDDLARAESRLSSVWFGSSHRIKQAAYQAAKEMAGMN